MNFAMSMRRMMQTNTAGKLCSISVGVGAAAFSAKWASMGHMAGLNMFSTATDSTTKMVEKWPERFSYCSYAANAPIEDRASITVSDDESVLVSVIDGHGGWQVAEYVREKLSTYFFESWNSLQDSNSENKDGNASASFSTSFRRVEEELLDALLPVFRLGFGNVARIGACTTSAHISSEEIVVANAGDCQCVLGLSDGNFERLTNEHNAKELKEQGLLQRDHPDESMESLVRCKSSRSCYVKGVLQPTRSIGDFYLKDERFQGPTPSDIRPYVRSDPTRSRRVASPYNPPYIKGEPEITILKRREDQEFLVIASDGLWDELRPYEVIRIIKMMKKKSNFAEAASALVEAALMRVAKEHRVDLQTVLNVPAKKRRSVHDDITCIVVDLKA